MTYKEQLADPRWQKKRLQILERDKWTCQICLDTESQLQIHHKEYDKTYKTLAWEYPDTNYTTLCCNCHLELTSHINYFGDDDEFSVLKLRGNNGEKVYYVYSSGSLHFKINGDCYLIPENNVHQIVQFLINNWLKNG